MAGTRTATAAAALVLAALGGCGGDDKPKAGVKPQPTQPARPPAQPLTQQRALAFPTGTPRAEVRRRAGQPLPIEDYALTREERRNCDYYPFAGASVSYDNVFRLCFKQGKLFSVSTAPSRKVAGPGAGAPSPKRPHNKVRPVK